MSEDPKSEPDAAALLQTLRATLLSIEETRADLLALAARVVALTEQVAASSAIPAEFERAVDDRTAALRPQIAAADALGPGRLHLGADVDKYALANAGPPCLELLPLCQARCCTFIFGLSTQDLDEGVIKWDHGQPYLIRHGDDGYCVHHEPASHRCQCHDQRPGTCRTYDCRNDARVWTDFASRTLAPAGTGPAPSAALQMQSAHDLEVALTFESMSLRRQK